MEDPYAIAVVMRRVASCAKPEDKVFPVSANVYRLWWGKAYRAVAGLETRRLPPHACRHTGASRDLATVYRTFEQVKRRGRWKADDSVQRYAKTHAWLVTTQGQSPEVRTRGGAILELRHPRPAKATE